MASRHVDEANIYTERTARRVLRFALYRLREAHKDIIYFLTGREPAPSPDEPSISAYMRWYQRQHPEAGEPAESSSTSSTQSPPRPHGRSRRHDN